MKVNLRGNVLSVVTGVTKAQYEKFSKYQVFTVEDEDMNEVYKLQHANAGAGALSPWNIVTNTTVEGKLALIQLLEEDQVETIYEDIMPGLLALKANESIILTQIAKLESQFNEVKALIEVEE